VVQGYTLQGVPPPWPTHCPPWRSPLRCARGSGRPRARWRARRQTNRSGRDGGSAPARTSTVPPGGRGCAGPTRGAVAGAAPVIHAVCVTCAPVVVSSHVIEYQAPGRAPPGGKPPSLLRARYVYVHSQGEVVPEPPDELPPVDPLEPPPVPEPVPAPTVTVPPPLPAPAEPGVGASRTNPRIGRHDDEGHRHDQGRCPELLHGHPHCGGPFASSVRDGANERRSPMVLVRAHGRETLERRDLRTCRWFHLRCNNFLSRRQNPSGSTNPSTDA